jgi:hypothetical protein
MFDYCEGIECGPDAARVLIGCGMTPDECDWLPQEWRAGLFPLGPSREHFVGWRGLVLAAVSREPDPDYDYARKVRWAYDPEDAAAADWECGWQALVRVTRLLAHFYGLISSDRLLSPYPASRDQARLDVEPLLDGLVRSRRESGTPGESSPASGREGPTGLVRPAIADPERPVWDETARVLWFRGLECKRFKRPAPHQETILAAFQEDGWPDAIDDPLAPGKLVATVESLNDRLQHIKFGLNGVGTGVCWQPV